jgi:arginine decarboxylase
LKDWDKDSALEYYRINRWGDGYFSINENGELSVHPQKEKKGLSISIPKVIAEMKKQNVHLPAVIRFQDILRDQVKNINETFLKVIKEADYQATYRGVFPIKVNQIREVVEEIVEAGEPYSYGLEAGSKTELLAVLAYNKNKNSLTILNGYKDEECLRLSMLGQLIGRNIIVVIEKLSELPLLIRIAKEMKVTPKIGIRAKLATKCKGKWISSSGDAAKFGLHVSEILDAIEILKQEKLLKSLKLLHFHIGSQLNDICDIKDAITEAARIFVDLQNRGLKLEYFDAGGGLGVDYDGSQSTNESSINYNLEVYASDLVYILKQICDQADVKHPIIVTESGRALVASHSMIVANVFDKITNENKNFNVSFNEEEHFLVTNMRDLKNDLNEKNYQDISNDAKQFKNESLNAFKLGVLKLDERAKIETLYWLILYEIKEILRAFSKEDIPEGLRNLDQKLSVKYLCNFSVFQSLPDCWAIGQLLPIVPLERLIEKPNVNCTLADITCDSDGRIDRFIGDNNVNRTIMFHELKKDKDYNIGIFMTGAYQEVMGDNHNLFGRLNEVHVYNDEGNSDNFYIEKMIKGISSRKILQTLQYNDQAMANIIKKTLDEKIKSGEILRREGGRLIDFYEYCLKGYTYLNRMNL